MNTIPYKIQYENGTPKEKVINVANQGEITVLIVK